MPAYILRNIDAGLWARFKARSEQDGIPMRSVILLLIEAYADKKVGLSIRKT